jgi:hypothetical protein
MNHPSEITQDHRNRLAAVYCHLPRADSSIDARARLETQRDQIRHARKWGWPESAIVMMDGDVGRRGSAAKSRTDFQRLWGLVQARQVGLVLVSDLNVLGGSIPALAKFAALCGRMDTLIAVLGVLWNANALRRFIQESGSDLDWRMRELFMTIDRFESKRRRLLLRDSGRFSVRRPRNGHHNTSA